MGKKQPKKITKSAALQKVVDERFQRKGGGILRREVWRNASGQVVAYNLAYINTRLCGVDNGRILGYDNNHGHHHRHFRGAVEDVEFTSYEDIETRFQEECYAIWQEE
ncbi:DUF6516 family protein [Thermithiobacillus plumbiphilus]|uniref:DUF6516 family protein n=1 Tax=Thermithiobacillus plumbiphilus TaxID=1729899 RepID=A0ABU9D886_9PROT